MYTQLHTLTHAHTHTHRVLKSSTAESHVTRVFDQQIISDSQSEVPLNAPRALFFYTPGRRHVDDVT